MNNMKYLIFPDDPSIYFMSSVLKKIENYIEDGTVKLIKCLASNDGYNESKALIQAIPQNAKVIFIGHSTPSLLYGGMSECYPRQSLVKLSEMSLFKDKELLLVSCFSNQLLFSSRGHRNYSKCMGFGLLPSEIEEVSAHRGFRELSLEIEDIEAFKSELSELIAGTVEYLLYNDACLEKVFSYFKVTANKRVSEIILAKGNRKVANILFYVVNELSCD